MFANRSIALKQISDCGGYRFVSSWVLSTYCPRWFTSFNFHITNFPFLSSNIPNSPAYGVFISQLTRYARVCSSYECFSLRVRRLSSKLLKQGYLVEHLKSSFRKFYGRYGDFIQQYEVSLSRILNDILTLDQQWLPNQSAFPPMSWPWYRAWLSPNYEWFPWSICNGHGMPAGNAYPAGHLVPSPSFWELLVLQLLRPDSSNLPCVCSTFHLEYPRYFLDFAFFIWYLVSFQSSLIEIIPGLAPVYWYVAILVTLLPNFGGFHRTLQRVRLANRGRLLLRTPGHVPFETCICSNVETIFSWACHVYGPFEFRTSLGTSILLQSDCLSKKLAIFRSKQIYLNFSKQ